MNELIEYLREVINTLIAEGTHIVHEELMENLKEKTLETLSKPLLTGDFTNLDYVIYSTIQLLYHNYINGTAIYPEYLKAMNEILIRIKNEEIFIDLDSYYDSVHTIGDALCTIIFYTDEESKEFLKESLKNLILKMRYLHL